MEFLFSAEIWVSLLTLTALEIVLGVDNLVFSLDSVITAVGLVEHVWIMVVAIVIAILLMIFAADPLGAFIDRHPTVKMLALAFLLLVGVVLVADGMHFHIPRGYVYFAIAFSVFVEAMNQVMWRRRDDS